MAALKDHEIFSWRTPESNEQNIDERLRRSNPIVGPPQARFDSPTYARVYRVLIALILVLGAGIGYGILDSRGIRVEHVVVPCRSLPPRLDGFSFIQLSDLHSTPDFRRNEEVARLLERLQANVMIITGDFRRGGGTPETAAMGARIVVRAAGARMPVYAVQGNNDTQETMRLLENEGIQVLSNHAVPIADRLWLVGWDPYQNGHPHLPEVLGTVPENAVAILASHSPDVILEEGFARAQLILAGHTHGVQIRIPGLPSPITLTRVGWRYTQGLYGLGETYLYINRGIGTSMVPLRVYSAPEITLIRLRYAP
jgi:predicted MPP superfamily phosphohydrolase